MTQQSIRLAPPTGADYANLMALRKPLVVDSKNAAQFVPVARYQALTRWLQTGAAQQRAHLHRLRDELAKTTSDPWLARQLTSAERVFGSDRGGAQPS